MDDLCRTMKVTRLSLCQRCKIHGSCFWPAFVLSTLLLATPGCESLASRGMNAEGVRLFQQGQYAPALQQFQQAIYNDPKNPDGYYNLAATYHRMGNAEHRQADLEQAERLYNQCLDQDPNHRECYRGLAVLLIEQNRTQEAFRLVQGWVERQPTSADARIELARLCEEFGDVKSAKERLVEALSINPNDTRALAALGKIREQLGEKEQALANYQRALALNRFQPEVAARVAALQPTTSARPFLTPAENSTWIANQDSLRR